MKESMAAIGIIVVTIVAVLAVDFLVSAGLVWLVCWAFGWSWSWKLCIGIFAVMLLVSFAVKARQTNNNRK